MRLYILQIKNKKKEMKNMSIWAWIQPVDRIWKVLTDPEEGTVKVYDEKNEEEFLKIVATKFI